ncbi:hypothetical protein B0J12DRAFT_685946 [Macrophomina phaseolina]|uniref:1-alkyl-2-acetylglycerophosphocholine esterase n=1 Tax=Macrophomina phaseolina TaxID=35725 RepID=A0ABQ8FTL6_9PEZI|nr:hypothetical protein B0J12DRAFT_685946 [Macrophomina phaseolina]
MFTPGAGVPIIAYTAYLSELASHGFSVIGIDHPGEAPYTALPYGLPGVSGLPALNNATPTALRPIYANRIADIQTVMSTPLLPSLVTTYGRPINTTHFAAFGHSIGGDVVGNYWWLEGDRGDYGVVGAVYFFGEKVGCGREWGGVDAFIRNTPEAVVLAGRG